MTLVAILALHTAHESTFYQTQTRTTIVIVVVAVVAMLAEKTTSVATHCGMYRFATVRVHMRTKIQ